MTTQFIFTFLLFSIYAGYWTRWFDLRTNDGATAIFTCSINGIIIGKQYEAEILCRRTDAHWFKVNKCEIIDIDTVVNTISFYISGYGRLYGR